MTDIQTPDLPPYSFDLYQAQSMRTAKKIDQASDLIHAGFGITSEAGEIATTLKKWAAYGTPLDVRNLIEEMGDCLWFISYMCTTLGLSMQDVAVNNIAKLYERFPEAYSDEDALARADKAGDENTAEEPVVN